MTVPGGGTALDPILAFLTQPLVILIVAVGVFTGRVVIVARRLRSASRSPMLADTRALEEAQRALDSHRTSLQDARDTVTKNLGGARDTLRDYKAPLNTSIESRRRDIAASMRTREDQRKEFEALRDQKAFKDAKKLVRNSVPHKPRRSPKDI
jgi:seryl-tRNA synthetase